ncbi:MAG: FAD binding domain-containing protein [Planctomycetaceae bacterium]|nr:FAD binding domain-containing protein [Planctomycetaceae bacterium]
MNSFEYAHPETETEALEFLNEYPEETMILAGGTDALNLIKQEIVQPRRVVDLKRIQSLQGFTREREGLLLGATLTLAEIQEDYAFQQYPALLQVIENIHSLASRSMGTVAGDLCHLPNCWYFRTGYGLLAWRNGESLPEQGRNQYHAILGNTGPAKYVCASRLAPALIAVGASVRVVGPTPIEEKWVPLEKFYRIPKTDLQGTTILNPGQFVTHIRLPNVDETMTFASYEVLPSEGLDWPTATASVSLKWEEDIVQDARIVLGHVAPLPWISMSAARLLIGQRLTEELVAEVAETALTEAVPLSENRYKISQAKAAIKRALLSAIPVSFDIT